MHAANLEKSERLQRTYRFIRSFGKFGATSFMIQGHTGSMAVATDVSELRRNGLNIECKYIGTRNGRRAYSYTYKGKEHA